MSFCKKRRAISILIIVLVVLIVVANVGATAVFLLLRSGWFPLTWPRIVGSGNLVTEEKDFSDFTIVELEAPLTLKLLNQVYTALI